MKLFGFIAICTFIGVAIAMYVMAKKRDRKLVWNPKVRLTLIIVSATICIMFGLAILGSGITPKLF